MKFLHRSRLALIALLLVLSTLFASCDFLNNLTTTPQETTAETTPGTTTLDSDKQQTPSEAFDYNKVPAFTNQPHVAINNNTPYFTEDDYTTTSYEFYSELDALGRCGVTMACLGKDLMPTGNRGSISHIKPTGWKSTTYETLNDGLYNRTHLIGWQLAGENTNDEKNLITGTRYCNVVGMLPFENEVADYIKETNNHVLYRVTPIFIDGELVARGVLMEAWSVEDNGDGICFNVFVYNVHPGIIIDHKTGESCLENPEKSLRPEPDEIADYVLNTSGKKVHFYTCANAASIKEKNRQDFHGTLNEILNNGDGYVTAGCCLADKN